VSVVHAVGSVVDVSTVVCSVASDDGAVILGLNSSSANVSTRPIQGCRKYCTINTITRIIFVNLMKINIRNKISQRIL